MKYILMMNTMKSGSQAFPGWSQNDLKRHIQFMMNLNKELRESGELVSAEGLSFPDQAKLVRADRDGTPITDGIFPESKEFLAGYWIASAAPGPGGVPLNMAIEVRPIVSCAQAAIT
jgi:hypothetical protein